MRRSARRTEVLTALRGPLGELDATIGVTSSTLLEFEPSAPYVIVNYAGIPSRVGPFMANQLLWPSFYRNVAGPLGRVGLRPCPLFARRWALRCERSSTPGSPEVLQVRDLPVPKPGPGEIRVRIQRVGLNPVDAKSFAGLAPLRVAETVGRLRRPFAGATTSLWPDGWGSRQSLLGRSFLLRWRFWEARFTGSRDAKPGDLREVAELVAVDQVDVRFDRVIPFDLASIRQAHSHLLANRTRGKIVVNVEAR